MKRRSPFPLATLLLCVNLAAYPQASGSQPKIKVIKAGQLLDVASGKVLRDQVIVIRSDLIESVGTAAGTRIPEGAEIVDLSGSTVLPGLIDTHTHLTSDPVATGKPATRRGRLSNVSNPSVEVAS